MGKVNFGHGNVLFKKRGPQKSEGHSNSFILSHWSIVFLSNYLLVIKKLKCLFTTKKLLDLSTLKDVQNFFSDQVKFYMGIGDMYIRLD